jgi:hypothetical protein
MNSLEHPLNEPPLEVGYIIAYDDGRRDKIGRFPLLKPEPEQLYIFKKIVELEPSIREASYIFGSVRLQGFHYNNFQTLEYKKDDIRAFLRQLAQPGIIKIY